jgi:hypothetical protein
MEATVITVTDVGVSQGMFTGKVATADTVMGREEGNEPDITGVGFGVRTSF